MMNTWIRGGVNLKSFTELRIRLKNKEELKTVVIANATDSASVEAAVQAKKGNIANSILVGNKKQIKEQLTNADATDLGLEIIHAETPEEAAALAVKLIREDRGDSILKGNIQTGTLLKAVLNKETGIRKSSLLSHVTFLEIPGYHKVLGFTDGAMVLFPNFNQKVTMLENAVSLFHELGYKQPKVGVIEAHEVVNPKVESSKEAAQIMELQRTGKIKDCIIEGPISFDLATNPKAVKLKSYDSPVAGDVDLLVGPNITVINVMVKSLQSFAEAKTAGMVLGAKCPIVLVSRASPAEEKLDSIILSLV